MRPRRPSLPASVADATASPRFAAALAQTTLVTVLCAPAVRGLIGWPGYLAAVATLTALAAVMLVRRRGRLDWEGLLPTSILVFLGWVALSVLWSDYTWATVSSVVYQVALAFLAIAIGLTRDIIQIIRSVGDVLRVVLVASLAVEAFSGVLIDQPLRFLGVEGLLAVGGPIQGLVGTRNQLGLVCLLAIVTFSIEWATRSVARWSAIASIILAALTLVLTRSAISAGVLAVAAVVAVALRWVRRAAGSRRRRRQFTVLGIATAAALTSWLLRYRVIELLNAGSEFEFRLRLWQQVWRFTDLTPIIGWGWVGYWRPDLYPFTAIDSLSGRPHSTSLNALFDVALQVGAVGVVLFVLLIGLALWRSWLIASERKAVVHVWPVLVLSVLMVTALAESSILLDAGWLLVVLCAMRAAQGLSWRRLLHPPG
ncbi:exopolysaccharide production protein [Rathayibacter rathayi]|uniref:Exopolysaccharide production protein n=1 Tax=Rathayibacter rathayi TaxID=33887 RepID=A0ABD6WA77_RATRA|nr:O-antigen ligase family protein [Rathayibacter rathayi]AZZ49337.1 exopolysaccharide production protein [Rathayibacter rathayi]MWV73429.1 exopolysaccharide production protein [Rathayibacter rathayi NCPPB 2980 = VKM Ac-1601]PPF15015.1 exopolysaccharide production protein [Rathayibacter rathayi]PPF50308.1 exopolysaccharide production protein [Rathayibacter rathayi]PPF81189.1 exopolysaccharide production protein [Rathayibacter rathayi]